MLLSIISLLLAFIIAIGRQAAAFGKVDKAIWFFSNYEGKRAVFSIFSVLFGVLSIVFSEVTVAILTILIVAGTLLILSFLFDFKYIFPEIKTVERKLGADMVIDPSTKVIGVEINNIAVAYPMDVVIPRHIVNDKIGDMSIVVSYCAICRSALAFNSEVNGKTLYMMVSAVWRRNMVMIDQTKSLWQQATGESIFGQYKGKYLELLSGENTNWGAWMKKHPDSEYAYKCVEARRGYLSRKSMLKGLNFITPKVLPPGFTDLTELPVRDTVFGITHNGISRAYPLEKIQNLTNFNDFFNTEQVDLVFDRNSEYLTAIDTKTNKQIIVEKHWWLGWKEFHPETEIWTNKGL